MEERNSGQRKVSQILQYISKNDRRIRNIVRDRHIEEVTITSHFFELKPGTETPVQRAPY